MLECKYTTENRLVTTEGANMATKSDSSEYTMSPIKLSDEDVEYLYRELGFPDGESYHNYQDQQDAERARNAPPQSPIKLSDEDVEYLYRELGF